MDRVDIRRLGPGDVAIAADVFEMMARVFDEGSQPLGDDHVAEILGQDTFWAFAAFSGAEAVGCLTAHTLPMTRSPSSEVFIYDLAVRPDYRRRGIASELVREVRTAAARAGIYNVFVPADADEPQALAFYRAQGAAASEVTIFTFDGP